MNTDFERMSMNSMYTNRIDIAGCDAFLRKLLTDFGITDAHVPQLTRSTSTASQAASQAANQAASQTANEAINIPVS